MKMFKEKTIGKAVIMGRKTFDSLNKKPLPKRLNIVISDRLADENKDGFIVAKNIQDAISIAEDYGLEPIIIGGASIYSQTIDMVNEIYVTVLDTIIEGDTFFPQIKFREWERTILMYGDADDDNQYKYTTYLLTRKYIN